VLLGWLFSEQIGFFKGGKKNRTKEIGGTVQCNKKDVKQFVEEGF
jgi:hypothetical protein